VVADSETGRGFSGGWWLVVLVVIVVVSCFHVAIRVAGVMIDPFCVGGDLVPLMESIRSGIDDWGKSAC
jgi:hypothetical protein